MRVRGHLCTIIGTIAVACAATAWPSVVYASEWPSGTLPGNACDALDGKQAGDISKDNGRALNTATSNRQVVCAIPISVDFYLTDVLVLVWIEDNSTTEVVSCTLHARDALAESDRKQNEVLDIPMNSTAGHLGPSFTGKSGTAMSLASRSKSDSYYMWCRLPPNSSVLSLSWTAWKSGG